MSTAYERICAALGLQRGWHHRFRVYRPSTSIQANWNREFASGHWDGLASLGESPRYGIIAAYCQRFVGGGAILDVGCGQGLLAQMLPASKRYFGVDVSDAAIRIAANHGDSRTNFQQADAETFVSDDKFDVIVFNECLFYFLRPQDLLRRYESMLVPGGVFVVSMYEMGFDFHIWRKLSQRYQTLASTFITTTPGAIRWNIKVLRNA
jgi:2-polyprenyl-3-methyl-5-hydroxy-6-metoxy-1,4-benzoquinol methylase